MTPPAATVPFRKTRRSDRILPSFVIFKILPALCANSPKTQLVLYHHKSAHVYVRVMCEAKSVDTAQRLQLPAQDQCRPFVTRDDRAVDIALNPIALHREGDLLGDGCLLYTSPSPRDRQKS